MKKIIKTLLVVMVLVLALAAFTSCGTVIESFKHIGHDVMTLPAIAPTCAKEGLEEGLYCNDCHVVVVEQKTIAKLEHEMVPNEDRAPTCNLVGLQGGTHCKHCGLPNGEQVEVPVIDCIYGEPYVYQAPTCGVAGFYAMDCTMCGTAKKGDVIPATGEHSFTVDVEAKDPTCGADGYTAHKDCDVCGAHDEDYAVLNATGEHSFTVDVEAKDPTCVEVGYNAHKDCDVCGAHDETYVEVPADEENGHSFPEEDYFVGKAPTCTEPGIMAGVCEHCGEAYGLFYIDPTHVDENEDGICDVCEETIHVESNVVFEGTVVEKTISENLTYITNNSNYPNPSFYSDGGLKMNFVNQGVATATFEAQTSVTVTLTFNALNKNEKQENADVDAFTVYGLDADGNVVATVTTNTVSEDKTVSVVLEGEGIVSVKVIMTDYYTDGTVCYNLSLASVVVEKN